MSTHPAAAPRVHYAWIVAGITFVTLLAAAGIRATPGVLIVPFEHEFGWTRATISLAVSVNLILYGLMGPFSAALVDRLGARTTMICAMVILGIGVSLTSLMTASWQLVLLWGIVVGAGSGMIALALPRPSSIAGSPSGAVSSWAPSPRARRQDSSSSCPSLR